MRHLLHRSFLLLVLLASACDGSAIDPARSLVGAKKLPSARILSRETIEIEREFDGPGAQRLTFELRPDDNLIVTLAAVGPETPAATQSFHLASGVASDARSKLWRLRPEELGKGLKVPSDCRPQTAGAPDIKVVFTPPAPGAAPGSSRSAIFGLPAESVCNSKNATKARNLIKGIIHSFPTSSIVAEYWKRKWRSDALASRSQSRAPHPNASDQ